MKIYAVSDMHGRLDGLDPSGCDVCVVAGDFAPLNGFSAADVAAQAEWARTVFVEWTAPFPHVQFVVVPGNHDLFLDPSRSLGSRVFWPANMHLLIDRGETVAGLKFYGSPRVPVISGCWAFESRHEALDAAFSRIPPGVDVLVTHAPPRVQGCLCDVSLAYGDGGSRFGSTELAAAVAARSPRLHFFGHIHTGDHEPFRFGGTVLRNVSRTDEAYRIAFEPAVVEI